MRTQALTVMLPQVNSLLVLVIAVGLAAGHGVGNGVAPTTEKTLEKGKNHLKGKRRLETTENRT